VLELIPPPSAFKHAPQPVNKFCKTVWSSEVSDSPHTYSTPYHCISSCVMVLVELHQDIFSSILIKFYILTSLRLNIASSGMDTGYSSVTLSYMCCFIQDNCKVISGAVCDLHSLIMPECLKLNIKEAHSSWIIPISHRLNSQSATRWQSLIYMTRILFLWAFMNGPPFHLL
jgi:hypothetical protein